jgi:Extensin-like protein C-terminus
MTHGVRLYLVGSLVLVSLAGCGRGFFQSEEREPWRTEAEIACLKSGAVKETADLVRISPISGPGVCGAEFPLKVAALGERSGSLGFTDEVLRPPGDISNQPRWPGSRPPPTPSPPVSAYPETAPHQLGYGAANNTPISLAAPGVAPDEDEIDLPPDGGPATGDPRYPAPQHDRAWPPTSDWRYSAPVAPVPPQDRPLPRLGPADGTVTNAVGPVAVKPEATLACPIVSVLNRWLADSVQPAAMRWFGARVVEIKQISAYSCRGMNGNSRAHISEHAFGNALDIAAFTLADGRHISVEDGWKGLPEEQGFLRDVQATACQQFNTVLAPGSNVYHYNHIHVDLMRRAYRPVICQPAAVSGEAFAARAAQRSPYASRDPAATGALSSRKLSRRHSVHDDGDDEDD